MSTSHDQSGPALLQAVEYALTSVTALAVITIYPYLFFEAMPLEVNIADMRWVEGVAVTTVLFLALFLFCKHYFATEGVVFRSLLQTLVIGVGAVTAGLTVVLVSAPEVAMRAVQYWFLFVAGVTVFVLVSIWLPHVIANMRRR